MRGKAFVHRPLIERRKAQKQAVQSVLGRFFAGSAEDLVLRLIEDEHLTEKQLDEVRQAAAAAAATPKRQGKGRAR